MDCFRGKECRDFLNELGNELKNEIESLKDAELANTSHSQWVDFFYEKYRIEPVSILDTNLDLAVSEPKVQVYNQWSRMDPYEQKYYSRDGFSISCKVPFAGDSRLFELRPSSFTLSSFHATISKDRKTDEQWLVLEYSIESAKADPELIKKHFALEIESFAKEVEPNCVAARNWNEQIKDTVELCLDKRTSRLDKFNALKQSLNIPLKPVSEAHARCIPIKRRVLRKPKPASNSEPNFSIDDSDYSAITEIIDSQCATFEIAPSSYHHLGEEQLRDIVLAMLNTHYEQGATGETFRGKGKTDINILFDNHAAYIAECKLWKGQAAVSKAIDQLYGYLTWRDTKVSLIIFNKDVQDFPAILVKVDSALRDREGRTTRLAKNRWQLIEDSKDSSTSIKLTVQVYNLYSGC